MTIHNTGLEAKVAARNRVNKIAMANFPAIYTALTPFVGKKIVNVTGHLSDRTKKALPALERDSKTYWGYYDARCYTIYALFKVCEVSKSGYADTTLAAYAETELHLGELDPQTGVLTKLATTPVLRTDYTIEEIEELRKVVAFARNAMHNAEFKLSGFGEYDNS